MALWLIIIIVSGAFIGATLTLHAVAQCKQTSELMLEHYRNLLAEARREKEKQKQKEEKEEKHDGAAEPPASTDV